MSLCTRDLQTDIAFWQYGIASSGLDPISRHKHIRKFLNYPIKVVSSDLVEMWANQNVNNKKEKGKSLLLVTIVIQRPDDQINMNRFFFKGDFSKAKFNIE